MGLIHKDSFVCLDCETTGLEPTQDHIIEIKFLAKGCVPAMACASALVEFLQGKTFAEASALKKEELIESLGGLPEGSTHAGSLAIDAVAALLRSAAK